jgi:hypothetical protein
LALSNFISQWWIADQCGNAKKIGRDFRLFLFRLTILSNYLTAFLATFFATGFLAATFLTGAFLATFLTGAFFAVVVFLAGAGFFAAGLAVAFFAAGISYPPFHSAVAEDKKLLSFQFA